MLCVAELHERDAAIHSMHRSAADLQLQAARTDHLEVISTQDVTLVELLGTGSFGDMYKGTWRDCEVAVKALNPVMVGLQYFSRAAWIEFLQDANKIGALRHPNLVEVYGVVLPSDPRAPSTSNGSAVQQHLNQLVVPRSSTGGSESSRRASLDANSYNLQAVNNWMSSMPPHGKMQKLPGTIQQVPAMVMEYVSGRSLRGAIQRMDDIVAGKLTRIMYMLDCAKALAYLHSKGIAHYNFKSANVLLAWRHRRPTAKVVGYGLSTSKVRG